MASINLIDSPILDSSNGKQLVIVEEINDKITTHNDPVEINIELLCDSILLEVFSNLNGKDLQNASLVNTRWSEIIGSSTVTMKQLQFEIKNENLQFDNFGSNRMHQNFVVSSDVLIDCWTGLATSIQLERVKSLQIRRSRFHEHLNYPAIEFLSRLTELEKLSLVDTMLNEEEQCTQQIVMRKLRCIHIIGNDFTILKYVDAKNLQELQCTGRRGQHPEGYQVTSRLIGKSPHLKRLILRNCMEVFEHLDVNQLKCKLNYVDVYHTNVNPNDVSVFHANLRQFLLQTVDSLRDLKLDFSMFDVEDGHAIVNDLLQIVFNKCKNLGSLDIRNLSISRDGHFYRNLSPNITIKHLKVHWGFDGIVVDGLLQNCPKLERLDAEFCHLTSDGIKSIATNCKELIHLSAHRIKEIVVADVIFEKVKFLHISRVENSFDPLMSLVIKCPAIEQIRVDTFSNVESIPIESLLSQPTMRKFIIQDKCYDIHTDIVRGRIVNQSHFSNK